MNVTFIDFINQSGLHTTSIESPQKLTQQAMLSLIADETQWSKSVINNYLKTYKSLKTVNLSAVTIADDIALLPHYLAVNSNAFIFEEDTLSIHVALSNPTDLDVVDQISLSMQKPVIPYLALSNDIQSLIQIYYSNTASIESLSDQHDEDSTDVGMEVKTKHFHQLSTDQNLDQMVYSVLAEAVRLDATDIHIELNDSKFLLQYRIMKQLTQPTELNAKQAFAFRQKLVLMSNGIITQTHRPQDLSFSFDYDHPVFCRLSILPTVGGFSIVIRVFKEFDQQFFKIKNLIQDSNAQEQVKKLNQLDSAMVIISGPVNSGKTSLLYSSLIEQKELNKTIISIEDPVEVRINGINQIEISPDIEGLSYSSIIKSSARQNPDIVSFGEIRESDVANLAVNTASTGILAYATIHASSCVQAITRMIDMDVRVHMLNNTLKYVFSQRLLQKLCPKCSKPHKPSTQELTYLKRIYPLKRGDTFHIKQGCPICNHTGTQGLTTVVEDLTLTPELKSALQNNDFVLFNDVASKAMKTSSLTYRAISSALNHLIDFNDLMNLIDNYEI